MSRDPFAWEVRLCQDVLDDATAELRRLPCPVVREIVTSPPSKTVKGRDDHTWHLTVTSDWRDTGSEEIEVAVQIKRGWLGRTLTQSFVVTAPAGADRVEHTTAPQDANNSHGPYFE